MTAAPSDSGSSAPDAPTATSTEDALLEAALAGDDDLAHAIMASSPPSVHPAPCRLAVADPRAVEVLDARTVNVEAGPNAWPPLLYLVGSRYQTQHDATRTARLGIAKALLELGADPNIGTRESETIRELVDALLERGADLTLRDYVYDGTAAGWAHAGGYQELAEVLAARLSRHQV